MSYRLQVLIPPELDAQLRKAARRSRISKGELVRRALRDCVQRPVTGGDPLQRLSELRAPTADIDKMLSEIEAGRA